MFSWKFVGLAFVFIFFMGGGISHFTNADFFVAIMPPYLGWHLELVYLSGVFEILGAIGVLIPRLRQLAGAGLIVLVICVTPANVHMWMNPELFPDVPQVFLTIRLVLQLLLLWLIWWSTRVPAADNR
jgi:uncharacterized membrane protein